MISILTCTWPALRLFLAAAEAELRSRTIVASVTFGGCSLVDFNYRIQLLLAILSFDRPDCSRE